MSSALTACIKELAFEGISFSFVTTHPSFLRKQESIRIAVNASLPDGFLLSQE